MTNPKRNDTITEAAQDFYAGLTVPEKLAFDDLAETLQTSIQKRIPGYPISVASLREAVFAVAAFDCARSKRVYSPATHLMDMTNA